MSVFDCINDERIEIKDIENKEIKGVKQRIIDNGQFRELHLEVEQGMVKHMQFDLSKSFESTNNESCPIVGYELLQVIGTPPESIEVFNFSKDTGFLQIN